MNPILRPVAAEFSKIFSTRIWWILALVLFGYIALIAGGLAAFLGGVENGSISPDAVNSGGGADLSTLGDLPPLIYSFAASVGYVFPVLLGALATTGEFRHQTLTPTFLATPKRGRVLSAKIISMFTVGAGLGLVGLAASAGLGALVLNGFGIDPMLADGETWALIGRTVLAMALWAVIGVGLGVLVPSQVASIVIVLAFTQFVEPLLRFASAVTQITADIGKFLPGAASDALVGASFFTLASPGGAVLESWQGGLVLLAYGLLATAGGYFTSWKRDVT
ncbi:ABC transporter permease [Cryobacterium sp.]|uniref:ABC transporter permease n=1 Tax=Cryobacterium sp. TaxID=1926290 RepID=UPI00260E0F25|nr:ABC transporter permease [Cryobacterium sp.]MCU1444663.1 transporter permease [Cryobacterium sp.]